VVLRSAANRLLRYDSSGFEQAEEICNIVSAERTVFPTRSVNARTDGAASAELGAGIATRFVEEKMG